MISEASQLSMHRCLHRSGILGRDFGGSYHDDDETRNKNQSALWTYFVLPRRGNLPAWMVRIGRRQEEELGRVPYSQPIGEKTTKKKPTNDT